MPTCPMRYAHSLPSCARRSARSRPASIASSDSSRDEQQLPVVAHLLTIPGVGLLTATALLAFIGDIRRFPSARHLASYLGLTPREYSSGLKRHLGRISKRGDGYLRTLLIHGARSVLLHARTSQPDRLRELGDTSSRRPTSTTRPPWLSPTSSLESSGRSGLTHAAVSAALAA